MSEIRIVEALGRLQDEFEKLSKEQGPQGEIGPQGPQGERGTDGKDGKDGRDGVDGRNGADGKDGRDGLDGIQGPQGPKGQDGKDGKDGKNGKNGKNGKDGKDGVGIKTIKVQNYHLIVVLTNGKRIDLGLIRGIPGLPGANGISVTNAEIKHNHLYITLSDGTEIDAGYVGGGGGGSDYDAGTGIDITNYVISVKPEEISYEDLADLPTIPEKTSDLQNDSGFITSADVPTKTSELQNDSGFITSSDIPPIPEKTSDLQNDSGFITANDIPPIPSKTSDLQNDSGFITSADVPTKTSELQNDSGFITSSDIPAIPTKTSDLQNDSGFITSADIPTNVSDFTNDAGYITSSDIPTDVSAFNNDAGYITSSDIPTDVSAFDNDAGYITSADIPTDVSAFDNDAGYITDDKFFYVPISSTPSTTVKWDELYQAYSDGKIVIAKIDYLQSGVTLPLTAPLYGVLGAAAAGTFMFTFLMGTYSLSYMVTGTGSNVCTVTLQQQELEILSNKVQSVVSNSTSTTYYPTTKAVFDEFQRKPVVVWQETTPANYLLAIQADLSASPAWQLTNLDLTPFKRIKIYSCAGRKSSGVGQDASTTPAMVLEMDLDPRAAIAEYGGNYCGSTYGQKPNDANRFATLTCAVSADKTSFVVLRQTNIYGTAATSNNDANANVFMIEGYYD